MLTNAPTNEGLRLYVNGVKEDIYIGNTGRLYTHGGRTAIGCVDNDSFFDDGPINGSEIRCYDGDIAEVIYFNEPNKLTSTRMNEARIQIIHNHLAAKYDLTSPGSNLGANQFFDPSFSDHSDPANFFGNEVAGIGQQSSGVTHLDAKGTAEMRVSSPVWSGTNAYVLWGHNGESLTNTWPFSSADNILPPTINERSGKVWKFFERGDGVNTVQIELNFSESSNAGLLINNKDLLRLLVHSNTDPNDFGNALVYSPAPSQPTSSVVRFSEIPVTDGMYIALGNTSNYFNIPLPIELLHFNARLVNDYVDLNWATASELNNDYFVVERTDDSIDWKPILTVPGAGNSNTRIDYYEKDREPLKGISYYRLKQVDFDGSFSYSDPVTVVNTDVNDEDEVFMYPNPITGDELFLRLPYALRDDQTIVSIYDLSGKLMLQERLDAESDMQAIQVNQLTPGAYVVQIRSRILNETKKLIVQ
jgi:hypothetical protein